MEQFEEQQRLHFVKFWRDQGSRIYNSDGSSIMSLASRFEEHHE